MKKLIITTAIAMALAAPASATFSNSGKGYSLFHHRRLDLKL